MASLITPTNPDIAEVAFFSDRFQLVEFALDHEDIKTSELSIKYTNEEKYVISEILFYPVLKDSNLITAPAL